MKKLIGTQRVHVAELDRHTCICDLVHFEGPLVSLYKGQHANWIYQWCDTDEHGACDRWLAFPVERKALVSYLQKDVTLRVLVESARCWIAINKKAVIESGESKATVHRNARNVDLTAIAEYLPAEDSFFDESLTPDISLTNELLRKI